MSAKTFCDHLSLRFFKCKSQKLVEKYCKLCKANLKIDLKIDYELDPRSEDPWRSGTCLNCSPYLIKIYNLTKYNGKHIHCGNDIKFGEGNTLREAWDNLFKSILKFEGVSNEDGLWLKLDIAKVLDF